jgi:hypothetical protein
MRRISTGVTFVVSVIAVFLLSASPSSQGRQLGRFDIEDIGAREAVAREILVKFQEPPDPAADWTARGGRRAEGLQPVGRTVASAYVAIAERRRPRWPHSGTAATSPSLSPTTSCMRFLTERYVLFPLLWGLKNTGQPVNGGAAGTAGADIHAAAAWDLTVGSASNVSRSWITGINYMHDDLVSNMWSAPAPFTVDDTRRKSPVRRRHARVQRHCQDLRSHGRSQPRDARRRHDRGCRQQRHGVPA